MPRPFMATFSCFSCKSGAASTVSLCFCIRFFRLKSLSPSTLRWQWSSSQLVVVVVVASAEAEAAAAAAAAAADAAAAE